ncbi:MAG: flagellar hook capping FlgD N-terminal domain-containing protein [Oscillospiraceae bacterium]
MPVDVNNNVNPYESASSVGRPPSVANKKENEVNINDFLNMMVNQLKNQDFMNPVDDAQYLTQMAQFASMQQMQELAEYSKSNYAISLAGKNVTVAAIDKLGNLLTASGPVQKISLTNNEYKITVQGKEYTMDQIMEINGLTTNEDKTIDTKDKSVIAVVDGTDVKLGWQEASSHPDIKGDITYTIYMSKDKNMDTVEDVIKNGTVVGSPDRKNLTGEVLKGLDEKSQYYINVIATDKDGKKYVYKKAAFSTGDK